MTTTKKTRLLVLFLLAWIAFVFGNSLMPSFISGEQSGMVLRLIQSVLRHLDIQVKATEHMVRKMAHFTEYAALGALLLATLHTCMPGRALFPSLFVALLVPVLDEGLQLLIPGRSGQVSDVLLDFFGTLVGMLAFTCLRGLWHLCRPKKKIRLL